MTIEEFIANHTDSTVLIADGFDSAFVGIADVRGTVVSVYDEGKCIDTLRKDGMSTTEAREYFDFNVAGSGIGEHTPIYLKRYRKPKLDKQEVKSKIQNPKPGN